MALFAKCDGRGEAAYAASHDEHAESSRIWCRAHDAVQVVQFYRGRKLRKM